MSVAGIDAEVIIAGAGPVGLTLAACLAQHGIATIVLEALPQPARDLRGSTFHPPTLDLLEPFGVVEAMLAQGVIVTNYQLRDRRSLDVLADFDFGLISDATRHPYRLQCEQYKLTALLLDTLRGATVDVRFGARYANHHQADEHVVVSVQEGEGERTYRAHYLVGADGIGSAVRQTAGIPFEGFTYPEKFLTVSTPHDFSADIPGLALVTYLADPDEWCLLLRAPGLWRVMFPIPPNEPDDVTLADDAVQRRLSGLRPLADPYEIVHRTLYPVQQRVAASLHQGRVCLAGDAAHANNPLGGMGLNSGIHDAVNLGDKLHAILRLGADAALLDRYSRQRRQVSVDHINAQAERNKRQLEATDPAVREAVRADLRATAADPVRSREFLLRGSLIASLREAELID